MYQCLGLGTVESGGCGEDWWHPECLVGLPRGWHKSTTKETNGASNDSMEDENQGTNPTDPKDEQDEDLNPLPPGFPEDDEWEALLCYRCVDSNPWLKRYANTPNFTLLCYGNANGQKNSELAIVASAPEKTEPSTEQKVGLKKRHAEDDKGEDGMERELKRTKSEDDKETATTEQTNSSTAIPTSNHKHDALPLNPPSGSFSLFMKEDFREHFCHCPDCFPHLVPHPQLREEEDTYEPPLSEDGNNGNGGGSQGTGSLLDRGEAALSNMDRVRAIEGVMVYNHLRDKVKEFLKPFAESGQAVSAEDIKSYFEKLRGDDKAIREAGGQANASSSGGDGSNDGGSGDQRREQRGT
jgi:E3 ubiquitin-protein ligase UBR7